MTNKKVGDVVRKRLIYDKLDTMYELCTVVSVDVDANVISISDSIGDVMSVDPDDYEIVSELTKRDEHYEAWDLHRDIAVAFEKAIKELRSSDLIKDKRIALSINAVNRAEDVTLCINCGVQIEYEDMVMTDDINKSAKIAHRRFVENYEMSGDHHAITTTILKEV